MISADCTATRECAEEKLEEANSAGEPHRCEFPTVTEESAARFTHGRPMRFSQRARHRSASSICFVLIRIWRHRLNVTRESAVLNVHAMPGPNSIAQLYDSLCLLHISPALA